MFPEFRDFLDRPTVVQAASDLTKITPMDVRRMIQHLPKEWGVCSEARTALVDLVVRRAAYVAEMMEKRLWPQGELFPEDEMENPEK